MTASVTGSDGNTVTYLNDTDRSLVTSVTDPASNTTTNSYDVMRRPTVTQTGSSALTNTYADDLLVGLSHTNAANVSTQYILAYTTADLLSSVRVGSNRKDKGMVLLSRNSANGCDFGTQNSLRSGRIDARIGLKFRR